MPFVRRSLAALSGIFLLQLTLLGSGTLCAVHVSATENDASARAMHQMVGMSATESATQPNAVAMTTNASDPTNPVDCNGPRQHGGCRLPFAPGQCSSMTACDVSATPAAMVARIALTRAIAPALSAPALAHSGPTFAPELPPPRA